MSAVGIADHPGGTVCTDCARDITGKPYALAPEGMTSDGSTIERVVCVRCEVPGRLWRVVRTVTRLRRMR